MGTKLLILALGISLVCISLSSAKETFYSALESEESVRKEGGIVNNGEFKPAKVGDGFLSEKDGDLISFPTAGRFTNLKAGTIEFWVKLGVDVPGVKRETFWFYTYTLPFDGIIISLDGSSPPPIARLSIRCDGWPLWFHAQSPKLKWKEDEIHHVAGTWGKDGMNLYLDGELAGSHPFLGGPTRMSDSFAINNADDLASSTFYTECVVDELRISDHQKKPDEFVMDVRPGGKVAATWGSIKNMY